MKLRKTNENKTLKSVRNFEEFQSLDAYFRENVAKLQCDLREFLKNEVKF